MAFAIKSTLQVVESALLKTGYFKTVQVGEPKQPPDPTFSAAIFMASVSVPKLTLTTTIEVHNVMIRIYMDMLKEPLENIEFDTAEVVQKLISDLLGDFDLGATIRHIDPAGAEGGSLTVNWGHDDVGGTMYRIVDLNLPLVVDDSASLAA